MGAYRFFFRDLNGWLGWRFPLLIVWMTLVGLGEGSSIALLLPLLSQIGFSPGSNPGAALGLLQRALALVGATDIKGILAVIVAVAVLQTGLYVSLNWWMGRLGRRYQRERQMQLFRAFMRAHWTFITGRKSGDLTNVIVGECERLAHAFWFGLSIISTAVVALTYFILSLWIAWQVTLILVVFATLGAVAMLGLYRKSFAAGQVIAPLNAEVQSMLNEQFAGIKIVKATASEERAAERLEPLLRRLEKANALVTFLPPMVRGLLEFFALVGLSLVIVIGGTGFGVGLGNVVVVVALFARLYPRLTTAQAHVHYLNGYVHAIETIAELQSAAEAEAERLGRTAAVLKVALPAALRVQELTVKLDGRAVLENVNLTMALPGMLAVVGASGAGKSTLVHALLGLVPASAGSIGLGPHELASTSLDAWRRAIGYVPQETILFHASVRENLTLANPAASATEVDTAVRRAQAHKFIAALPQGYDTVIGDQGVKLSGGQRQRLGIARALLTNPTLLLLDEAMSALDAESEAVLLQTLDELRKQLGIVMVAHRIAAVRAADVICVLEAGRVVECGTWSELMARRTRLYALAEAHALAP